MEQLLAKHPDLKDYTMANTQSYKVLDMAGNLIEAWQKDENGHWVDITEQEQEKIRLEREIKALQQDLLKHNITPLQEEV